MGTGLLAQKWLLGHSAMKLYCCESELYLLFETEVLEKMVTLPTSLQFLSAQFENRDSNRYRAVFVWGRSADPLIPTISGETIGFRLSQLGTALFFPTNLFWLLHKFPSGSIKYPSIQWNEIKRFVFLGYPSGSDMSVMKSAFYSAMHLLLNTRTAFCTTVEQL